MPREQYISVEGEDKAKVDFLNPEYTKGDVEVFLEIEGAKLNITVKASHGDDSSSWDLHEFSVALPLKA